MHQQPSQPFPSGPGGSFESHSATTLQRPPGSVRAARAIIFVMAAIGAIGTVALIGLGHSYAAGGNVTGYFFFWALAITACFFGKGHGGVRVTATVFAVLEGLVALGSTAAMSNTANVNAAGPSFVRMSPGPIGLIAVIVIIALLYGGSAGQWFKRPQVPQG